MSATATGALAQPALRWRCGTTVVPMNLIGDPPQRGSLSGVNHQYQAIEEDEDLERDRRIGGCGGR